MPHNYNVSMDQSLDALWGRCLQKITKNVNQQSFRTWFEPIKPVKLNGVVLTIQVPSQFFYEWLEEHYVGLLHKTLRSELGSQAQLEYQIVVDQRLQDSNPSSIIGGGSSPGLKYNTPQDNFTKRDQSKNKKGDQGKGMPSKEIKNPFVIPGIRDMMIDSQLISAYTFDNFIEGECNQLARSAGIAVANKPGGTAFNPLVLYGGVGLGKTHLAHAIGNHVKTHLPNKTILYVSSEKFTYQFIEAVKNGSIVNFMNFYQLVDLLIVDDIQFFANKDRTQDIFFHTFNHLHQSGKQIILTSDRAPKDLEGMEERLLSRFKWGLTADMQVPDFETRVAILEKKTYSEDIEIPRNVIEFIAYHVNTNVREMEGALVSLMAQSSLRRMEIDLSLAKFIVKNLVDNLSKEISIGFITQAVSEYFNIPIEQMKGKTRKRNVVQARQISMYLAKKFTELPLKQIGKHFGGRDHSTVIHACQAVLNLMETDRVYQKDVLELQKHIEMKGG